MNSLGSFDTSTTFSTALRLIYHASYYNDKGIREMSDQLEYNFSRLSGKVPFGKQGFCEYIKMQNKSQGNISPVHVVSTTFFQSMVGHSPPSFDHHCVVSYILPEMLKPHAGVSYTLSDSNQDKVIKEWMAKFIESIVPQDQIMRTYKFQGGLIPEPKIVYNKIKNNLIKSTNEGRLNEKDFDAITSVAKSALDHITYQTDHFSETQKFTGWFLTLFGMDPHDSRITGDQVISGLAQLRYVLFGKPAYVPPMLTEAPVPPYANNAFIREANAPPWEDNSQKWEKM